MKIRTIISYVMYSYIAKHLPKSKNSYTGFFERIRAFFVRGYIDFCGECVNIQPLAIIARRVSIGNFSGIGRNCLIQSGVCIGEHIMMGPEVYIYTQNHEFTRIDTPMDQQGWSDEKPVVIEDDVWIGSRVTILGGVTIGRGSIIGASSVVTKSCPPYSIVAGNPAQVVKKRTAVYLEN